jgi:hypothetical protein
MLLINWLMWMLFRSVQVDWTFLHIVLMVLNTLEPVWGFPDRCTYTHCSSTSTQVTGQVVRPGQRMRLNMTLSAYSLSDKLVWPEPYSKRYRKKHHEYAYYLISTVWTWTWHQLPFHNLYRISSYAQDQQSWDLRDRRWISSHDPRTWYLTSKGHSACKLAPCPIKYRLFD